MKSVGREPYLYDAEDDGELYSWEDTCQLDSIGLVGAGMVYFSISAMAKGVETTSDSNELEISRARMLNLKSEV